MFKIILSPRIRYDKSRNRNNFTMITIHQVKQIKIRPVLLFSPITLCLFVSSYNSFHKQFDIKNYDSSQSTHSCTQLNDSTTKSENRSLNPWNFIILAPSHKYWLDTVLLHSRWQDKRLIYRSGSPYFNMATKPKTAWYFGAHLLLLLDMFSMRLNSMFELI